MEGQKALEEPGESVLRYAQRGEHAELVRLLNTDSDLVNSSDADGYTPLHRACYNGRLKAIGVLLARGADVNAASLDGWTPLHSAARWAKAKAITLLLENGSNVNAQTNGGLTALHLASSTSTLESTEGSAAIECSVDSVNRETLLALLCAPGVDVSLRNDTGETAADVCRRCSGYEQLFQLADACLTMDP